MYLTFPIFTNFQGARTFSEASWGRFDTAKKRKRKATTMDHCSPVPSSIQELLLRQIQLRRSGLDERLDSYHEMFTALLKFYRHHQFCRDLFVGDKLEFERAIIRIAAFS